jgi:predicted ATPase/DNA-binding SARP family transcriptional activator
MSLHVRLLGRPRVDAAAWPPERPYRLLAVLALRRGWVGRAELAALFWPGIARERAAANVRKALHLARGLSWTGALEMQAGAVRWSVPTDVQEFELAAREGRYAEALDLATAGELLDGMDDAGNDAWTEWLAGERALHRRRVHALTRSRLSELAEAPLEAARVAGRLLEADPLDEDAVVALLSALRALGRVDEQRAAYRSYVLRLDEELGVEPSQRVRGLLPGIERSTRSAPDAVPAPPVSTADGLFGRERDLDALCALLERDPCRLVTLTGPGGVGKSSLAKRALRRVEQRFADGACWIALDDLQDVAQVIARLAAELDVVASAPQPPLALVGEHLAAREMLLVLDNAEHLAELPRLVERLLEQAPRLRICATSRVRLGTRAERLLPLAGLAVPPPQASADEVLTSAAARLFASAAQAVRPDFDAVREARAIGAVVRATGGLPLAILLAANWVRLLPVAEIEGDLVRSLDVLESADEGEERPEHRSMRATFGQSWQRLTVREQRALGALSVFAGSFSREAASEVAEAALPLLAALADKSLLEMTGGARCSLHPLIRQFARETLDAEAFAVAQARHARYFHRRLAQLDRAAQAAEQVALDEIGIDLENFRQAWRWAVANRATEAIATTASALKEYFNIRGRVAEGLDLLVEARPMADESAPACGAVLLAAIAQMCYRLSLLDEAATAARQGIRLARRSGNRAALVRCLSVLGTCHGQWGRNEEARRVLQQAARQAGTSGDVRGAALAIHNLALAENALGNPSRAAALMQEWLASQREQGEWLRVAMGLSNLAFFYQAMGDWDLAQRCLEEGLAQCEAHDLALPRPPLLANLAHNHARCGRLDDAEKVCHQLVDEARRKALVDVEATALNQLVRVEILRGDFPKARARLRDAVDRAGGLNIEYIRLDCVLSFAKILAGERRGREAAPLLRYLLERPNLEPVDRAEAESCLRGLRPAEREATPAEASLDALLRQIAGEVGAATVDR